MSNAIKEKVFSLCFLRGYSQTQVAKMMGLSDTRISSIMQEVKEKFNGEQLDLSRPLESIKKRLAQLEDVRAEAWRAWKRSMADAQSTVTEKQLMTTYENKMEKGKLVRTPKERKLETVKEVTRIYGRLPANEYLNTIIACLREEARLEGLVTDTIVTLTQINMNGGGGGNGSRPMINWDDLCGRDVRPDPVELEIEAAEQPVVQLPPPQPDWSPAEVAELEDDERPTEEEQP